MYLPGVGSAQDLVVDLVVLEDVMALSPPGLCVVVHLNHVAPAEVEHALLEAVEAMIGAGEEVEEAQGGRAACLADAAGRRRGGWLGRSGVGLTA